MSKQIHKKLCAPPQLRIFDIILTLLPALLWLGATYARPLFIHPWCSQSPQTCEKRSTLSIDSLSIGFENGKADEYSYLTQNLAGVAGVMIPTVWDLSLILLGRLTPVAAFSAAGTDLVIIFQTYAWNGFFTEVSHLVSQRPRPFVYTDPVHRGTDPAHYTSFYSGHTSFTAAAMLAVFLSLLSRGAPVFLLFLTAIGGEVLVFSTAYFRILAGRHFLTDVLFGAIAGALVAWFVALYHRKRD